MLIRGPVVGIVRMSALARDGSPVGRRAAKLIESGELAARLTATRLDPFWVSASWRHQEEFEGYERVMADADAQD